MIKIEGNGRILEVSRGAFKTIYAPQGYTLYKKGAEKPDPAPAVQDTPGKAQSPETPILEMSMEELKEYARTLGLNPEDYNGKKALRTAVRDKKRNEKEG